MNGWIKLHRKSLESSIWANPNAWRVWCWCLMKATHQESKFPFNGEDMVLKPGQFITGMFKATKELKLTSQKYRTAIEYLKNSKRISVKATNQFTLISVTKWTKYQVTNKQKDGEITNEQQTDNKRITTYNNNKNVKKLNYFVFKDKTRGFKDKRTGKWLECDTFQKLEYEPYLKELKNG